MSVQDSFERAVAGAAAAALAEQRRVREAAELAVAKAAGRQGPVTETAALLERFRRAATGTANVKAVAHVQNWRGKWISKYLDGWRVSAEVRAGDHPQGGTYRAFLMLDTDGGLWIYSPGGGIKPWQLGQLPFLKQPGPSVGDDEHFPGDLCESSIASTLGVLVFQLGITL